MKSDVERFRSRQEGEITAALECPPEVRIPADFAARVARKAVTQEAPARSAWSGFGVRAALASAALLLVALFAYAPHTVAGFSHLRFDVELLLLAELGGVAWVAARAGLGE